jgi:hypothetical protein
MSTLIPGAVSSMGGWQDTGDHESVASIYKYTMPMCLVQEIKSIQILGECLTASHRYDCAVQLYEQQLLLRENLSNGNSKEVG